MSRKKKISSTYLSCFGKAFEIFKAITDAVKSLVGEQTDDYLSRLLIDKELLERVAQAVVSSIITVYLVVVDYAQSFVQMIDHGKYDWVDSNITPTNFPITGKGVRESEVVLFHFNRFLLSDEEVIAEMAKDGYRPVDNPAELFVLGAQYFLRQLNFSIVALGVVWNCNSNNRAVIVISNNNSKRRLELDYGGDGWPPDCRFAAVRES